MCSIHRDRLGLRSYVTPKCEAPLVCICACRHTHTNMCLKMYILALRCSDLDTSAMHTKFHVHRYTHIHTYMHACRRV